MVKIIRLMMISMGVLIKNIGSCGIMWLVRFILRFRIIFIIKKGVVIVVLM